MKTVYLYGFMGCGKSYTGKKARDELNINYADSDEYIVNREHKTIAEIFGKYGEEFFRGLELSALKEITADLVSLGGGALTSGETAEYVKENGIVIFINTPFETCYNRIKNDSSRPLATRKSKTELLKLYENRKLHYNQTADFIMQNNEEIIKKIKEYL